MKMKAAMLRGLNDFRIEEIDRPVPGPGEVLVKVMAAGICGSDIHKMQTEWTRAIPMVLGHEFAGEIVEVGPGVTSHAVGERMCAAHLVPCGHCERCREGRYSLCEDYKLFGGHLFGGFEQYVIVPEGNVVPIGDNVSYEEAAMVEPLAVAAHGVMGLRPRLGDTVAVFGLGTIGVLTVQLLRLAGAGRIIGIDIDPVKLEAARAYGVTDTVDPAAGDVEAQVMELTGGRGVDIAIECAGSPVCEEQALLITAKGGTVAYQGIAYRDVTLSRRAFENIFRREYTIRGFWNSYSAPFPGREWTHSAQLIDEGRVRLTDLITHRYDLDDIQEAFDLAVHRKEPYGKIMIFPNGR